MSRVEDWVSDYSDAENGPIFVMHPDADPDWADGFRNAHIHLSREAFFPDYDYLGNPDSLYQDGYLDGAITLLSWMRDQR